MRINWRVRAKHPAFWLGLLGAVASPVLAYFGATPADVTTWQGLGEIMADVARNPYLLLSVVMAAASFIGVVTDQTTQGVGDSLRALSYKRPNGM